LNQVVKRCGGACFGHASPDAETVQAPASFGEPLFAARLSDSAVADGLVHVEVAFRRENNQLVEGGFEISIP